MPLEVFGLSSLTNLLNLSKNSLNGSLPREVGMLKSINKLDVSENHLSGDIPIAIGECISLEYLFFQGNSFSGTVPSSLASLKGLKYLDLSRNRLFGPIPNDLQNYGMVPKYPHAVTCIASGCLCWKCSLEEDQQETFEDGQNLHMFVENSVPSNLTQILDSHLVPRNVEANIEEDENSGNLTPTLEKCLVSLFQIGLACSMESPKERMNIVDVTRELSIIKNELFRKEK
ncbi:unnamed protein product [Vicia faba]|uniref:Uncharacterized protein n=1 Tax=Vicia faba TaxID=3906 RepID=A0AAV0YQH2_VICFA|nr:unnamed protein product [Vicia faba]